MTIGVLMAFVLFEQKYGYLPQKINGVSFRIYDGLDLGERWGKRLRFGVGLADHSAESHAIKFEEREIGKFTVGVFSKKTQSIQYNLKVRFALNDPIDKLVDEFPGNHFIKKFVDCMTSSKL